MTRWPEVLVFVGLILMILAVMIQVVHTHRVLLNAIQEVKQLVEAGKT